MDFSKFDSMVDIEGLKKDIEAAEANGGGGNYKDVPHGSYEVAIDKLELTETKQTGKPMATCWMKIVSDGEYKGQRVFMNRHQRPARRVRPRVPPGDPVRGAVRPRHQG